MTPGEEAAAFHGMAENVDLAGEQRLLLAMRACELYEVALEQLEVRLARIEALEAGE